VYAGVWLTAKETQISTTRWAIWLGKDFTLFILSLTICAGNFTSKISSTRHQQKAVRKIMHILKSDWQLYNCSDTKLRSQKWQPYGMPIMQNVQSVSTLVHAWLQTTVKVLNSLIIYSIIINTLFTQFTNSKT